MAARYSLMLGTLAVAVGALGMPAAGAAPDPIVTQDQPPPTDKGPEKPDVPAAGEPPAETAPPVPAPPPATTPPVPAPVAVVPPTAPATEQTASEPKNIEPVTPNEATSILGKKVRGPDGKDLIGSVIDILIDDQGKPRAAIVDFGGFLGVGSRKIAVDWQLLKFHPADQVSPVVLNLDRSQIQAAPEYKDPTQPAKVVEPTAPENPAPPATPAQPATPTPSAAPAPPATPTPSEAAPPAAPAEAPTPPDAPNHPN